MTFYLIETDKPLESHAETKATIAAKLQIALGHRKIDLLLSAPNLKHYPIHDVAKKTGVRL